MLRKGSLVLALLLLGAGLLMAAGGGRIVVAFDQTIVHMDPDKATDGFMGMIVDHMFEALFEVDSSYKPVPYLAESYTMSPDGKLYTFKLRKGVKFHNGKEMTSADVKASMERWLRVNGGGKQVAPNLDTVTAPDLYTVVVQFKNVFAPFLSFMSSNVANQKLRIRPKELIDKYGDEVIPEPVGTGPYQLVEWIPDQHLLMKRFDGYSAASGPSFGYSGKKNAYADELEFKFIKETAVRIAGIQTGEYHFALNVPFEQYALLSSNPDTQVFMISPNSQGFIIVNQGNPPFDNVYNRQALLYALKLEDLATAAVGDKRFWFLEPSLFPPGNFWNTPGVGAGKYNVYDPAKVKELLKKGGYDGRPIVILNGRDNDYETRICLALKDQLEKVGFKVDLQLYDRATVVQQRAKKDAWNLHCSQFFTPDPDPQVYGAWMGTKKWIGNWDDQDSAKMDAIFERMLKEPDFTKRKAIVREWQEAFFELVPYVKLYYFNSLHAGNKSLQGFQIFTRVTFFNCWLKK
jgi:peptide/nickel transport system substrate-binding protein